MKKITWEALQTTFKAIFKDAKMKDSKDVLEKDPNGWNWIVKFDMLENPTSLILHTKFIFKLDSTQKYLRANEFFYLSDLNCKYRFQRFTDLANLAELINNILMNDRFGKNLLAVSEFMISPSKAVNKYFYEHEVNSLSVYDADFKPQVNFVPCKSFKMHFKFNINNKHDITMVIQQDSKDGDFNLHFTSGKEKETVTVEDLTTLAKSVAAYAQRKFSKGYSEEKTDI